MKAFLPFVILFLISSTNCTFSPRKLEVTSLSSFNESINSDVEEIKLGNDITIEKLAVPFGILVEIKTSKIFDLNGHSLILNAPEATDAFTILNNADISIINSDKNNPAQIYFQELESGTTNMFNLSGTSESSFLIEDNGKGITLGSEDKKVDYIITGMGCFLNVTLKGNLKFIANTVFSSMNTKYFMIFGDNSTGNSQGIIIITNGDDEYGYAISVSGREIDAYVYGKITFIMKDNKKTAIGIDGYTSDDPYDPDRTNKAELFADIEIKGSDDNIKPNGISFNCFKSFKQKGKINFGTLDYSGLYFGRINEVELNGPFLINAPVGLEADLIDKLTLNGDITITSGEVGPELDDETDYLNGIFLVGVNSFIVNGNIYTEGYNHGFSVTNGEYGEEESSDFFNVIINGNIESKSTGTSNTGIFLQNANMIINGKKNDDEFLVVSSPNDICFNFDRYSKLTLNDNVNISCGKQIFTATSGEEGWEFIINAKVINMKSEGKAEYLLSYLFSKTTIFTDEDGNMFEERDDVIKDENYPIYDPFGSNSYSYINIICKTSNKNANIEQGDNTEKVFYQCDDNVFLLLVKDPSNAKSTPMKELLTNNIEVDMSEYTGNLEFPSGIDPKISYLYYDNLANIKIKTTIEIEGIEFINSETTKAEELISSDNLISLDKEGEYYVYYFSTKRSKTQLNGKYYLQANIGQTKIASKTHTVQIIKQPILNYIYLNDKKYQISSFTSDLYFPKEYNLKKIILEFSSQIEEDVFTVTPSDPDLNLKITFDSKSKNQIIIESDEVLASDFSLNVDHKTDSINKNKINLFFHSLISATPTGIKYETAGEKIKIKLEYELKQEELIKEIDLVSMSNENIKHEYVLSEPTNKASIEIEFDKKDEIVGRYQILTKFVNDQSSFINYDKIINIYKLPLEIENIEYQSLEKYTYNLEDIKYLPADILLGKIKVNFKNEIESTRKFKVKGIDKEYDIENEGKFLSIMINEEITESKILTLIDENAYDDKGENQKYNLSYVVMTKNNVEDNSANIISSLTNPLNTKTTSNYFTMKSEAFTFSIYPIESTIIKEISTISEPITEINLGGCKNNLATSNNLSPSDLFISQVDDKADIESSMNVDFNIYSKDGQKLNLDPCINDKIQITSPINIQELSLPDVSFSGESEPIMKLMMLDKRSDLFNDKCIRVKRRFEKESVTLDIPYSERKNIYKEINLCDSRCDVEGFDYDIGGVKCLCNGYVFMSPSSQGKKVSEELDNKEDTNDNFYFLGCGKKLFDPEFVGKNPVFYIFLFLTAFVIICIIIYRINKSKYLENFMNPQEKNEEEVKGDIKEKYDDKPSEIKMNNDADEILPENEMNDKKDEELTENEKKDKEEPVKLIRVEPKKKTNKNNNFCEVPKEIKNEPRVVPQPEQEIKKEDKIITQSQSQPELKKEKETKPQSEPQPQPVVEKEVKKEEEEEDEDKDNKDEDNEDEQEEEEGDEEGDEDDAKKKANPPIKKTKANRPDSTETKILSSSSRKLTKAEDNKLFLGEKSNDSYCKLYGRALNFIHPVLKIFFSKEGEIKILYVGLLILEIGIQFFCNVLFYNETVVRYNYENRTRFDFKYNIKKILLAYLIGIIIRLLINPLVINLNFLNKNKKIKQEELLVKASRRIMVLFIIILLLTCFFWYFCSAFCTIFPYNAYGICMNSLIGIAFRIVIPFITAHFYVGLRNKEENCNWLICLVEVL